MSQKNIQIDWDNLTFSITPTDHMYIATCNQGEEWVEGKLHPYGPIMMDPAAGVLNYGQGIFEGMKAHRSAKGNIVLFRPEENAERFAVGAKRLGMPPVPEEMFLDAVQKVVSSNLVGFHQLEKGPSISVLFFGVLDPY